jgi:hypothetical protein
MKTLLTSSDQVRARNAFDNALTFLAQPNAFVGPSLSPSRRLLSQRPSRLGLVASCSAAVFGAAPPSDY